jgi:hypothetical protein
MLKILILNETEESALYYRSFMLRCACQGMKIFVNWYDPAYIEIFARSKNICYDPPAGWFFNQAEIAA